MLDLTSMPKHDLESLVEKYLPVLNEIYTGDKNLDIHQCAYMIDIISKHIQNLYEDINIDIKSWSVVAMVKLLKLNKLNGDDDVMKYVDEFIKYWNLTYDEYVKQFTVYSSEFERDHGLISKFITHCK